MKKHSILITAISITFAANLIAQEAKPDANNAPEPHGKREAKQEFGRGPGREAFQSLSPEEKKQIGAAMAKVKDQPALKQAREAMKASMKEAMLSSDPSIKPLIEKVEAANPSGEEKGIRDAVQSLSEDERHQFMKASREARSSAKVMQAQEALKKARHDALIAADSTIGPVLDKMEKAASEGGRGGKGGGKDGGKHGHKKEGKGGESSAQCEGKENAPQ